MRARGGRLACSCVMWLAGWPPIPGRARASEPASHQPPGRQLQQAGSQQPSPPRQVNPRQGCCCWPAAAEGPLVVVGSWRLRTAWGR
jgi:hypothetical protein